MVSGLLGGLPVTSVIVRSSANVQSGGKTKLSTILHGTLMLLSILMIPGLLNKIPLAALAAILIFTGYKLAKVSIFKEFWNKGRDQFIPFVVTILAILFTDLLIGILIGIVVGLFFLVRSNFHAAVLTVNTDNHYLIRLRKDVNFLNKPIIKSNLEEIPENSYLIFDASRADFIDQDIIDTVNEYLRHAHLKNIRVEIIKSPGKEKQNLFQEQPTPTELEELEAAV
jgi:MFS superfamily sulfate permease-like transporter